LFGVPREKTENSPQPDESDTTFKVDLVEVDEFSLNQLSISFLDQKSNQSYEFDLNSMEGAAVADEPLKFTIDGAFQKQRYYISISGDPIRELFNPTQPWLIEASAEMAGVTLNLSGQADKPLEGKGFNFSLNLNGNHFESLASIFGSQLPSVGAFSLAAHLEEIPSGYSLSQLKGNFGKTAFDGKLEITLSGDKPAVLAELMLPIIDGFELTRWLRDQSDTPIIMLTARRDEVDRIAGLEMGADDYIIKPFSPQELVSRVRAVLRRTKPQAGDPTEQPISFPSMVIDPQTRLVSV
jgi:CheY-like chemotaxis protein